MAQSKPHTKAASIALSTALALSIAAPVAPAKAHDFPNAAIHYGHGHHLNRQTHRQFHDQYGRGHRGSQNYQYHARQQYHANRKRKDKRDLIAAGVIGLAVGAIIASEASKRNRHTPQPQYQYSPSPYQSGQGSYYGSSQPVPLDQYSGYNGSGPEVITFNDPADLQPWTPGWREWCHNRYRSFNQNTGTFRGYDGLDHFCVPK